MTKWSKHKLAALATISTIATLGGCGSGGLGKAVRPGEKSVAEARGEAPLSCTEAPKYGSPLVVDWTPEKRGDLEVAMKQGVGVVAHDCKGTRLLSSCKARGSYGFMGISLKKETIELKTADELSANVPLGAVSLSASLSASSSIAIDLRMVGVSATTRSRLLKVELEGDCEGATHFVQTATLGAFVVGQKTEGSVGGSVSAVGVGDVKGDSSSSKNKLTGDGELDACEKWDPDSNKPPSACKAVLRLQLSPITTEGVLLPDDKAGSFRGAECPEGFHFKDGKCSRTAGKGKQCDPTSEEDCERQCKLGHVGSCTALGRIYREGIGKAKKSLRKAVEPLQTACDAGEPDAKACLLLARSFYYGGRELPYDEAKIRGLARRASWLLQGSCGDSNPEACWLAGDLFRVGGLLPRDLVTAVPLLEQGCNGGYARSCHDLAMALKEDAEAKARSQKPAPKDDPLALGPVGGPVEEDPLLEERRTSLIKRACNGGYGESCYYLALDGKGDVFQVDLSKQEFTEEKLDYMQRACDAEFSAACRQLASVMLDKDKDRSAKLWVRWREIIEKRCDDGLPEGCEAIGLRYSQGAPGLPADPKIAASGYERLRNVLDQRCSNEDAESCSRLMYAYRSGGSYGIVKDPDKEKMYAERYRKASERLCSGDNTSGCVDLASTLQRSPDYDGFLVLRYLERDCNSPHPNPHSCWMLGDLYVKAKKAPFEDDTAAVEKWWNRACDLGDVNACSDLAKLYAEGKVLRKDDEQAMAFSKQACKRSRYSSYYCGPYEKMLSEGKGGSKDPQRYFRHIKTRCEVGTQDIEGCFKLSELYAKGIGVKADKKQAQAIYDTRVCFDGWSCARVGSLYEQGRGVAKDMKLAADAYKKGCDGAHGSKPNAYACTALGNLYLNPKGLPDAKAALAAYDKACSLSSPTSYTCRERDRVATKAAHPDDPKKTAKAGDKAPDKKGDEPLPSNPYKK